MDEVDEILVKARDLAVKYRRITGKPLGITGEIAEFAAAQNLDLELAEARQPGFDAIRIKNGKKIQIKGRCIPPGKNPGQLGKINLNHEWDTVLLVILDENLKVQSMHEASRLEVEEALNERGVLGVNKFKQISKEVWPNTRT